MKKRPRRPATKSKKTDTRLRALPRLESPAVETRAPRTLQYKVVELSTVDEGALEETVNTYVRQGWSLDGVQFAMREASKRPAMAFVFFTRAAEGGQEETPSPHGQARERLVRLASVDRPAPAAEMSEAQRTASAYERLRRLAQEDDDSEDDG